MDNDPADGGAQRLQDEDSLDAAAAAADVEDKKNTQGETDQETNPEGQEKDRRQPAQLSRRQTKEKTGEAEAE